MNIPFEIVQEDGSLSNNLKDILDKWKNYFSNLLNQQHAEYVDNHEIRTQSNIADSENYINNCMSLYEVRQAARKLRKVNRRVITKFQRMYCALNHVLIFYTSFPVMF